MPAVPSTPFLPSRLGDGYGEESLLMAQEPIFEDQSFADNTFWTSTPRPDRSQRQRSSSSTCPDITIVQNYRAEKVDADERADGEDSTPISGLDLEDREYTARGEMPTWADEQRSEASSSRSKRGISPPGNVSESKRGESGLTRSERN